MAWQLIYTSAPRSLEAGRSGFGTVARHRAISPLLVSAIERASQFSRLPGADAGRVIFCYRIIAIGGGRFHVLSASAMPARITRAGRTISRITSSPSRVRSRNSARRAVAGGCAARDALGDLLDRAAALFRSPEGVALANFPPGRMSARGSALRAGRVRPGFWPPATPAAAPTSFSRRARISARFSPNRCD